MPNRGFKPMVREHKFDCGELAIVTFLQAREFGLPYVLLPATVVGRGQLHTVAYNSERGTMKPSDLNGKKFGVRSYTQTTGIWVRGILGESFGVDWSKVEITTMEDPHVAQYKDPSFVKRVPTMALFNDGQEVTRQVGAMAAPAIRKFLEPFLKNGQS